MLTNLPLDVIIRIACLLSFEDKISLMQTCIKLNNLIQASCLYESISMDSSKEVVEKMIVTFRKAQRMGRQTKYLTIDLDMLSNQMYSQLPTIFPNVVQLITVEEEEEKREEAVLNKFIKWKDTLTGLSDEESPLHTFCLLEKNVYSNLFELNISTSAFKGVMSHSSHINILKCIQNAPKLGILIISDCKITLAFLENVHNSCTRLYDFFIYGSLISTVDEVLPEYIVPAARMVTFKVNDTLILDGSCLFVRYLSHKYTGLSTLRISPTAVHSGFQSFFLIEEGIDRQHLQSALNTDHNATESIYREEGIPILSKISKTIKSLNLDSRYFNGMIRILNSGCVNLTTLSVLDDEEKSILFTDPNQLSLLHDLPALNSLTFAFNCSLQEYGYNTASKTVTKINVAIKGTSLLDDLDICWILSIFPSLQKIRIEYSNARLVCYQDQISSVFPSLSSVTFGVSAVHPKIFSMLYKIAPNIKQVGLTIYGDALKRSIQEKFGVLNLILPEVSLQTTDSDEANYKIDLVDWELEEFNLNVRLTQGMSEDEGFVLVVNSSYFVISRDFSRISAERYSLSDEYEELYRIIIDAPCAKTIRISNVRVIIDPQLGSIRFY